MTINQLAGVYYTEEVTYELTGVGSKIPIFIGRTGNSETTYTLPKTNEEVTYKVDGTQFHKFEGYSKVNQPIDKGGIGVESHIENAGLSNETEVSHLGTNVLLKRIKEFYEEARLVGSGDIGVPYIYVIDIGNADTMKVWENAIITAKSIHDATVEVYVGAKVNETKTGNTPTKTPVLWEKTTGTGETASVTKGEDLKTLLIKLYDGLNPAIDDDDYGLKDCAKNLDLRYAFLTVETEDDSPEYIDEVLKAITTGTDGFKKSRIGLCEPFLFGKTVARICCTPNNTEPGYFRYRSVDEDTFYPRTKKEMLELQNAGIIFNSDEHINGKIYPKMNLCVATSFAETTGRPADALFHARFNADDLLREVFEACYHQVKNNESATNIAYLQTRINKIVNDRISAEEMVKYNDKTGEGTKLYASESDANPYNIIVHGQIQPVKCTIAIEVQATIKI